MSTAIEENILLLCNSMNTLSNGRYLIAHSAMQGLCLDNNPVSGVEDGIRSYGRETRRLIATLHYGAQPTSTSPGDLADRIKHWIGDSLY